MARTFRKILEPVKISGVEIRNRIAMAPMGNDCLTNPEGGLNQRGIDYFIERARGGVGLIITGMFKVENEIEPVPANTVPLVTYGAIPSFVELADAIHSLGSKIFVQLTAGFGRVGPPELLLKPPCAPSAIPHYWDPKITCRALTSEEVEHVVKCFGIAAEIVAKSGMDGVEIHAVHEGYLLDQFAIAMFNQRTDKYGGDLRGRLTFPIEIVHEIKKRLGEDFPVSLRFSVKSFIKGWNQGGLPGEAFEERGRDLEESLQAAKILEEAGYDAFDADCGSYEAWYWAHPPVYQSHGCLLPFVSQLKRVVTVPVLAAGRLEIPELAEKVVSDGKADMVSIGRGLLTDPYWVRKIEEGKPERIRPCIGCHDGCLGRLCLSLPVSCALNYTVGRERLSEIGLAKKAKKVMVVGGGVAGLETARVAALRGHRVTLYEKSKSLGGHLIAASVPEFKKDLERLVRWYQAELEDLKIPLKVGTEVTPDLVKREKSEAVVIATGSKSRMLDVPSGGTEKIATDIDLLLGKKKAGEKVVIVGGGMNGSETSLWLAQQGKKVTLVEILPELMVAGKVQVPHANRLMLLDLLKFHGVEVLTNYSVAEVKEEGVVLVSNGTDKKEIEADTVGISVGLTPSRDLYDALIGKIPYLFLIGDAREVRNVMGSVWDAYEVARAI
jgi:2-enoate reductase